MSSQHTLDAKDISKESSGKVIKLILTGVEVTKDKGVLVIQRGTADSHKNMRLK